MTNIILGETPLISPSTMWKPPGPNVPDQSDRQLLAWTKRYPFRRPAGSLSQVPMGVPGLCMAVKIPASRNLTRVEASPLQKVKCKQTICPSASHSFKVRRVYLKPARPGRGMRIGQPQSLREPSGLANFPPSPCQGLLGRGHVSCKRTQTED